MSEKRIFVEGGGDSKELQTRCREGFHKLLEKSGFTRRVPRIVACGSRNDAYDAFKTAQESGNFSLVILIVDSEDPVKDIEKTWEHLKNRDKWACPANATDEQVFLLTTCMETWIIADRAALTRLYGSRLQTSALPATTDMEQRNRHDIQDALVRATRNCSNAYAKNKRSFDALANVDPGELQKLLPSFVRMIRLLNVKL